MWSFVRREEVIARLRIMMDGLQVVGLQALLHSRELEWFVVRYSRQSLFPCSPAYACLITQTSVLSVSGAAVGGGFGLATWVPYLCILPKDYFTAYWLQLSVVLFVVPLSILPAWLSQLASKVLWKGESSSLL